jgi:hypothetical protein
VPVVQLRGVAAVAVTVHQSPKAEPYRTEALMVPMASADIQRECSRRRVLSRLDVPAGTVRRSWIYRCSLVRSARGWACAVFLASQRAPPGVPQRQRPSDSRSTGRRECAASDLPLEALKVPVLQDEGAPQSVAGFYPRLPFLNLFKGLNGGLSRLDVCRHIQCGWDLCGLGAWVVWGFGLFAAFCFPPQAFGRFHGSLADLPHLLDHSEQGCFVHLGCAAFA